MAWDASADATATASAIRSREVSAVEVLDEHRRRAAVDAERWGAIVHTDFDAAHRSAADRDRRLAAGVEVGPLCGVPMTVKDSFDVAGMRTSHGRLSDAHWAVDDAPAVARLRGADAVVFGKSNVPVLLSGFQTENADFGRTSNPWAADRSAGGSSGGSAVAVATGTSALELGSDLAGSIRVPAAWNGVFGHRPSNGIVSKRGHLPWAVDSLIEPPNSVSGPLARSARDVALALGVLVGASGLDAAAWRVELPPAGLQTLRGVRVGVWLDCEVAPVSTAMRRAVSRLADGLASAGAEVVPLSSVPGADAAGLAVFDRLVQAEIAHSVDDESYAGSEGRPGSVGQSVRDMWRDAEYQRRIRGRWSQEVFTRLDVVLAPAVPDEAALLDDRPEADRRVVIDGVSHSAAVTGAWSRIANLAMLPCTVIPAGLSDAGLPLGAQLIGPYLADRRTIRVAEMLEREGLVRAPCAPGGD